MPIQGSNFVVHGTRPDSTIVTMGPFNGAAAAINIANEALEDGYFINWTITYDAPDGSQQNIEQT